MVEARLGSLAAQDRIAVARHAELLDALTIGSPPARARRCGWLAALCRSGTNARLDAADLDELADRYRLSRRQIDPTLADAASERLCDELGALA